jgi:hypothetical protein
MLKLARKRLRNIETHLSLQKNDKTIATHKRVLGQRPVNAYDKCTEILALTQVMGHAAGEFLGL